MKKNHEFIDYYHQVGGETRYRPITNEYYHAWTNYTIQIDFNQHKNFYDFFDESIINDFLTNVYEHFVPDAEQYKIMGYAEIINYQPGEVEIKSTRMWLTNVYTATHFIIYVRDEIGKQMILKITILNGETGSSWIFKRFNRLQVIFTSKNEQG